MNNKGRRVTCDYIGTLDDGTVFDSSKEQGYPIEFICGNGEVIDGFDAAVRDMEIGEEKSVHLSVEEAYGEHDDSLVHRVPLSGIPNASQMPVGQRIVMQTDNGFEQALVVSVEDGYVTLDMNHPLAGTPLNFEIKLIKSIELPHLI